MLGFGEKQWIQCDLRLQSAAGIIFVKIADCAEFFLFPTTPAWQTNDHLSFAWGGMDDRVVDGPERDPTASHGRQRE
jgi:hypothetical protein